MAGEFLPPVVTVLEANIDDVIAKVEEAKALFDSLGKSKIPVNFDISNASMAAVKAKAQALARSAGTINLPVGFDINALSGAKLAGIAALMREQRLANGGGGGGGGGRWFGWLRNEIPTFNGPNDTSAIGSFMNKLPLFTGTIQAWHLALDGVGEALAVVLPAVIGLGIYGAIAGPVIGDMTTHLKNLNTVVTATGQNIAPLTGGFGRLQDAVKPSVYQLYGDAVSTINSRMGTLQKLATGVGSSLDQLGARAAVALKSAGMSQFMANASTDVKGIGTVIGNVFGIIGNLLKTLPGYAQGLLNILGTVTHGVEVFTGNGVVQGITHVGLAFHGAWIWGGVFAALLGKGITSGLTRVAGIAGNAAVKLEGMGVMGGRAATAMDSLAGGAGVAAALPWGWIAAAAIGVGILAYKLFTLKDATGQWIAQQQAAINASSAGGGLSLIMRDQIQAAQQLAQAHKNLAAADKQAFGPGSHLVNGMAAINPTLATAMSQSQQLPQWMQSLSAQTATYNQHLAELGKTYGGTKAAQGLLIASGVSMGDFLSTNKTKWAQVQQQVLATSLAYQQMGQRGGRLGADMSILDKLAGDQYTAMQSLNQAWTTFLGLSTGLQTGFTGLVTGMRGIRAAMRAAGASFTGVSNNSLTLQNDFSQQITNTQGVIASMRQANASSKSLANVMSSVLAPAVNNGALANSGFRQQVYDMAVQAGYTGSNQIAALTKWIDKNYVSTAKAAREVQHWAALLAGIPANQTKNVTFNFGVTGNAAAINFAGGGGTVYTPTPGGGGYAGRGGGGSAARLARGSGGSGSAGGHTTHVHVHLNGKQIFEAVKQETYGYNTVNNNRSPDGRVSGTMAPRR